jgi:hypothetical protein
MEGIAQRQSDLKSSRERLLEEVKRSLRTLLFLSNEELEERMAKIELLPEAGLVQMKKKLQSAHKKQLTFFRMMMQRDHMFASNINSYLT